MHHTQKRTRTDIIPITNVSSSLNRFHYTEGTPPHPNNQEKNARDGNTGLGEERTADQSNGEWGSSPTKIVPKWGNLPFHVLLLAKKDRNERKALASSSPFLLSCNSASCHV